MNKLKLLILFIFSSHFIIAQNGASGYSNEANSAEKEKYLSAEEKQVIYYLNLVRSNPALFEKTYLKKYLDSTKLNNNYTKSLIKTLKETKSMGILKPSKDLFEVAKDHAIKFGKAGKIGHDNFKLRMKPLNDTYNYVLAENCDYGNDKALDIVMSLLIDDGIADYGHRKNILDSKFKFIGISIQPHKKHDINCVMDFGGEKVK